jgi:hypothetical protein
MELSEIEEMIRPLIKDLLKEELDKLVKSTKEECDLPLSNELYQYRKSLR